MLPPYVFVLTACSASRGVFALWQRLLYTWVCLVYSSLCCPWTCLFCSSLCCPWTCLFFCSLCCIWAHLCVSSTVQQSVLSPEVSVLQQLVLHLYPIPVQEQPVLCQKMAYSSLWCTWTVCLQEPVLHRDVSVYKSFCVHLRCLSSLCCTYSCPSIRALCCTWKCLSSRACAAFVHFCLPELCSAPVLVCSLQEFCTAPGRVCLQECSVCYTWRSTVYKFFLFVSVFFETGLFVSVVSIRVRNTETNRKIIFWFHETNRKTTETDCVSVLFVSNRKYILFVSRTP